MNTDKGGMNMDKRKILVVEDEFVTASEIRARLTDLGFDVPAAVDTGLDAIRMAEELKPDIIVMDITLKGKMNGIEAAEQIRARFDIPIIFLTAHSDDATVEKAVLAEPFGYLIKPLEGRALKTTIQMALYKSRTEQEIKKRDAILFAVSSAVEWLLRISRSDSHAPDKIGDFDNADIQDILEPIGLAVDASSIGIFTIQPGPDGSSTVSMKYEWIGSECHRNECIPELKLFTFSSIGVSHWYGLLSKGEFIPLTITGIPETEKTLLNLLHAKSGAIIPIFIRDNLWGFIGFFDITEKIRSADEIEALKITANLLGAAMGYR